MAVLHYGASEIGLTDPEVKELVRGLDLHEPGLISLNLKNGGWVHLVKGPGIPIWIDQRLPSASD
jgi:hypothetical protein